MTNTDQQRAQPIRVNPAGSAPVRRTTAVAAALLAVMALATVPGPTAAASAAAPGIENPAARAAVLGVTGSRSDAAVLPVDFPSEVGYRPIAVGGLLVDPSGDCSSPVPLPAEFTTVCRAHDLGYDLLRYADDRGQPLGPWARQAVDAAFGRRLHALCAVRTATLGRARCEIAATVADTAVDLNSRRQNYAAPRPEYLFGSRLDGRLIGVRLLHLTLTALVLCGVLGAAGLAVLRRRRAARR